MQPNHVVLPAWQGLDHSLVVNRQLRLTTMVEYKPRAENLCDLCGTALNRSDGTVASSRYGVYLSGFFAG